MNLEQHIQEIRDGIQSGRFTNEASVSQGIVLRLLHALSWPRYDTQVVCPEYALEGKRVDFALCHPLGKPAVFIEVKKIGGSDGAEKQLFEYAFHAGVPLAILTDGQEWNFFLPAEQGDYGERRVYKLDIFEREIDESATRLERYLNYHRTISGKAINAAREDYQNVARKRQIEDTLPVAWRRVIDEEDSILLELVADKAESLCGYKPDLDMVAQFLKKHHIAHLNPASSNLQSVKHQKFSRTPIFNKPTSNAKHITRSSFNKITYSFSFEGKEYPARSAKDVLVKIIELFSARDPEFLQRFTCRKHGSKRRWVAKTPEELFPGRPDLAQNHSHQLTSRWWLGTNESKNTIAKIIDVACEVEGVKISYDLGN